MRICNSRTTDMGAIKRGAKEEMKDFLIEMKNFFDNVDKSKKELELAIQEKDNATQDILHEIELGNLNASETMKIVKLLKTIRKERRKYKDELQRINTLKGFTDKYNNKLITGDIIQLIKNLDTLENNLKTRTYKAKILTGLKCEEAKDEQV